MDVFQSILRNYTIVSDCIHEGNEDFLRLQIPELAQHSNVIARLLDNNNSLDLNQLLLNTQEALNELLRDCNDFLVSVGNNRTSEFRVPVIRENRRGRPKYDISIDLLNILIRNDVSWSEISRILNVSRRTLFNFRQKNSALIHSHRIIGDDELFQKVWEIKNEHPNQGYRYIWGCLKSQGIYISWKRLIACVQEIDPIGVYNRQRRRLKRRKYCVKAANYLWHMDGHEKLVHWHFYIHGCVDGFSRKVIYLQVAPTKQAGTVLNIFKSGVAENGLPMRVRADRGRENFHVQEYMEEMRADTRNPFIFGKSVHNQRIERMWREVNLVVCSKFRKIFYSLQKVNLLSQRSGLDLLCLCYVYLPRIQRSLNIFKHTWNHHKLRTAQSKSPNVLWMTSLFKLSHERDLFALNLVPEFLDVHSMHDTVQTNFELDPSMFGLSPHLIRHFNNIAHAVVPNPLMDDYAEGRMFYYLLRNRLLTQYFD